MTFTMKNTTVLAVSLLLNPALYGMHSPEEISQALITAAQHHNRVAYRAAARDAIAYAEAHPHALHRLDSGIALNTITPDYTNHALSLSYGIATNNPTHTTFSAIYALTSAWTLRPMRTENQNDIGCILRILTSSLYGLPLGWALGEAASHHSWQRALPTILGYGIHFISRLREEEINSEHYRLTERLNEIENNYIAQPEVDSENRNNNLQIIAFRQQNDSARAA